eukprot:TRINITY_DN20744_c0_g1_i1.p1 TRINITY_DN20744_c0_g1~~TRINITY_DN20744_c0_g1_i1.p1  ORF type:complete len:101 (-),score=13.02 TRINITY_DN20744_c0_g1_i1:18-320(-)
MLTLNMRMYAVQPHMPPRAVQTKVSMGCRKPNTYVLITTKATMMGNVKKSLMPKVSQCGGYDVDNHNGLNDNDDNEDNEDYVGDRNAKGICTLKRPTKKR